MLDGLDQIDWNELDAPDVPKWLRDLTSSNRDTRIKAYNRLEDKLTAEGSYSWENYGLPSLILKNDLLLMVSPLLIELLSSDSIENKDLLLQLLEDLARIAHLYTEEPYKNRSQQIYTAVREGIPAYRACLRDKSVAVKSMAAELLYELGETITNSDLPEPRTKN